MKHYYVATALKKISVVLLGLASSSFLARYLGVEARGVFALIVTWSAVIVVVFNFGLNYSFQKEKSINGAGTIRYFARMAVLLSSVIFLLYGFAAAFWGWKDVKSLALLVSVFSLLRMQVAFIALIENFFKASLVNVVQATLELSLLVLAFFYLKSDPFFAVLILCSKELLGATANLILIRPAIKKESRQGSERNAKISFLEIRENYLFTVLNIFFLKVVILAYSLIGGTDSSVGILAIAIILAEYFWFFSDISKDVLTKTSSDNASVESIVKSVRLTILLCIFGFFAYFLVGKWIVLMLYGQSFSQSFSVSLILVVGVIGLIPYKLLSIKNISDGAVRESNTSSALGFLIVLPVAVLMMYQYEIYGAAVSGALLYFSIGLLVALKFSKRHNIALRNIYIPRVSDFPLSQKNVR